MSVDELYQVTKIDPWFLENISQIVKFEEEVQKSQVKVSKSWTDSPGSKTHGVFRRSTRAACLGCSEAEVREPREQLGIVPVYKTVDTCAAEFVRTHAVPLFDL